MTPGLEVAPLGPDDDDEQDAFFEACTTSTAQQTPGWRDVITGVGGDEPLTLGCRDAGRLVGVLPAFRFEGPLGAILCSVPQAGPLGGVACHPDADAERVYAALLDSFVSVAQERACVTASVISNPFWPDRALYERLLRPDYVLENECQVLDLERAVDDEGGFPLASSHVRRNLRRAESAGLAVDDDATPASVGALYELHASRHGEIGAAPLPRALFSGALEHLLPRGKGSFFFVRRADSAELVAGGLYVHHGRAMDALMPVIRSDTARLGANYLLAAHSIRFARDHGIRFYNWQGSPPDGGVHRFKRQWGGEDRPYAYFTRVTGDVERVLASTPEELRRAYPWHYVLPFDRLGAGAGGGASSREAAWRALEGSR